MKQLWFQCYNYRVGQNVHISIELEQQEPQPFYGFFSGTTQMSQYQKKILLTNSLTPLLINQLLLAFSSHYDP